MEYRRQAGQKENSPKWQYRFGLFFIGILFFVLRDQLCHFFFFRGDIQRALLLVNDEAWFGAAGFFHMLAPGIVDWNL